MCAQLSVVCCCCCCVWTNNDMEQYYKQFVGLLECRNAFDALDNLSTRISLLLSEFGCIYSFLFAKLSLRALTLMLLAFVAALSCCCCRMSPLATTMPLGSDADEFIELLPDVPFAGV